MRKDWKAHLAAATVVLFLATPDGKQLVRTASAHAQEEAVQTPDHAVTWIGKVAEAIQAETAVTLSGGSK